MVKLKTVAAAKSANTYYSLTGNLILNKHDSAKQQMRVYQYYNNLNNTIIIYYSSLNIRDGDNNTCYGRYL